MELYAKTEDGKFVKLDFGVFDKDFITNKLIHVRVSYEDGGAFPYEEPQSMSKAIWELFHQFNSEILVTTNCNVDVLIFNKHNEGNLISLGNKEMDTKICKNCNKEKI